MERRYCEVRLADGRRLEGVAMAYGTIARLPGGAERFDAGAFGDLAEADIVLNLHHRRDRPLARTGGGGLALADGPDALRIAAELPPTREADDALALVRTGVLRGLSVEFEPLSERVDGGTRVVERARLAGIGLVDSPAYPASAVSARRGDRRGRLPWWAVL